MLFGTDPTPSDREGTAFQSMRCEPSTPQMISLNNLIYARLSIDEVRIPS
jgi:hypothetical protein